LPTDLLARHVASTFVLVLNWWVETDSTLPAAEVDALFRRLVVPTLTELVARASSARLVSDPARS
jgi:hypothetical protein